MFWVLLVTAVVGGAVIGVYVRGLLLVTARAPPHTKHPITTHTMMKDSTIMIGTATEKPIINLISTSLTKKGREGGRGGGGGGGQGK